MKRILNLFSLASLIAVSSASAAITYSGVQNIPIPSTFAGVSITLDRASANIYTTDSHASEFTSNIVRLLAEARMLPAVVRAEAIYECTVAAP